MLWNLLLTDPDNKPDIVLGPNTNEFIPLLITIISITITLVTGYIINKQHNQIAKLENRKSNICNALIWLMVIIICVFLLTLYIIYYINSQS